MLPIRSLEYYQTLKGQLFKKTESFLSFLHPLGAIIVASKHNFLKIFFSAFFFNLQFV